MFKFFRNIRKGLLKENKMGKYLVYAIGEIVLVVIGILIALQLNNWSTERKNEVLVQSYLERLKTDFIEMHEILVNNKQWEKRQIVSQELVLKACTEDLDSIHPIDLAVAIERTSYLQVLPRHSDTWEDLVSTGNVKLFKDSKLKSLMNNYSNELHWIRESNKEWDPWRLKYRELIRNVLPINDRIYINSNWDGDTSESPSFKGYSLNDNLENIITKLCEIEGLEGILADVIVTRQFSYGYYEDLELLQLEILEYLEKSLQNETP